VQPPSTSTRVVSDIIGVGQITSNTKTTAIHQADVNVSHSGTANTQFRCYDLHPTQAGESLDRLRQSVWQDANVKGGDPKKACWASAPRREYTVTVGRCHYNAQREVLNMTGWYALLYYVI